MENLHPPTETLCTPTEKKDCIFPALNHSRNTCVHTHAYVFTYVCVYIYTKKTPA